MDKRIDNYITKSADFAKPILNHLRKLIHTACPHVEETIKWGDPAVTREGKILRIIAAFKAHAALNFWRGQELRGGETKDEAMGQFGRLTSIDDLPSDAVLDACLEKAAALAATAPTPRKAKHEPKPAADIHPEFVAALGASPAAKAALDGFPASARRDYVDWIAEAKQDSTRAKRIATAIEWLSEGKKRHWKYERC